jgi:recombinational DNA repair protein RecR
MDDEFPVWSEASKAIVRARIDAKMAELEQRIQARKVREAIARLNLRQDGDATQPEINVA